MLICAVRISIIICEYLMSNLIWVRIFIASLALFGEGALASENSSTSQDNISCVNLVLETSNYTADTESDDNLTESNHQLVNYNLHHTGPHWIFSSNNTPVQARYLHSFPHAPPV